MRTVVSSRSAARAVPTSVLGSSLSYTKLVARDGDRGRVGWIGIAYADLAPLYVAALLTSFKSSTDDLTARRPISGSATVTIEFEAPAERVNQLLQMIRQCEIAGMVFRFIFMEPPSTLYEDRSRSMVLLDCKLTQVDGAHKWTITMPIGGHRGPITDSQNERAVSPFELTAHSGLPGGGPDVNGTLEDYF